MQFQVQDAIREQIYVKLALMGSSGSGKTYSSLRLATGMLEKLKETGVAGNGRILLANTEASRGRYYAGEFDYQITDLTAPYNPEMFVDLIGYAVEENYPILIIDTTSKEWEGKGGCLEIHQAAGGTYQAWGLLLSSVY
jgi:GTPase SAR1 family protein